MMLKKLIPLLILLFAGQMLLQAEIAQDSAQIYLIQIKQNIPNTDTLQFYRADRAESIAYKNNNDSLLCMSWYLKGVLYYYKGYHQVSNSYYFKALNSPEAIDEPNLQYRLLNNIGINYDVLGEYDQSLSYYRKAFAIEQKIDNQRGMAQTRINIGRLYRVSKDFAKSKEELELALDYFLENKDDYFLGLIYQNLNSLYIDSKADGEKVKSTFHKALLYYQKLEYQRGITELYNNQGEYFRKTDQLDSARIYIEKALQYNNNHNTHQNDAQLLLDLAHLQFDKANYENALQYAQKSYNNALEKNLIRQQINALHLISKIGLNQNNTQAVYDALTEINELQDSLFRKEKTESFAEMSVLFEVKNKNITIEKQQLEIRNRKFRESFLWLTTAFLAMAFIALLYFLRFRHNKLRQLYEKNIELLKEHEKNLHFQAESRTTIIIEKDENSSELLFKRLENIMQEEKLYANSQLNLEDLVNRLSTNQKYLSNTINRFFGSNFNDYINSYRIEEAQRLIIAHESLTMEQIMHQCGFRSRSTFSTAFKKFSGMTPGEFRKMDNEKAGE